MATIPAEDKALNGEALTSIPVRSIKEATTTPEVSKTLTDGGRYGTNPSSRAFGQNNNSGKRKKMPMLHDHKSNLYGETIDISLFDRKDEDCPSLPSSGNQPVSENYPVNSHMGLSQNDIRDERFVLPAFADPSTSMWTASHDANAPSEDRRVSLVNLLLRPNAPPVMESVGCVSSEKSTAKLQDGDADTLNYHPALIRVSMWCVLDGHGGGVVAAYASEVLLPHIATSISKALNCAIVSRGTFHVNGEQRDLSDTDFDPDLLTSDHHAVNALNPFAINYKSPEWEYKNRVYYKGKCRKEKRNRTHMENLSFSSDESESDSDSEECEEESHDDFDEIAPILTKKDTAQAPAVGMGDKKDFSVSVDVSSEVTAVVVENAEDLNTDDDVSLVEVEEVTGSPLFSNQQSRTTKQETKQMRISNDKGKETKPAVGTHSPSEQAAVSEAITRSFLSVDEGWINSIDGRKIQTSCVGGGQWNAGACALVVCTVQRVEYFGDNIHTPAQKENGASLEMVVVDGEITESDCVTSDSSSTPTRKPTKTDSVSGKDATSSLRTSSHPFRVSHAHDAMLYTAHCGDCRAILGTKCIPSDGGTNPEESNSCSPSDSEESSDSLSSDEDDDQDIDADECSYSKYLRRPAKRHCLPGGRYSIPIAPSRPRQAISLLYPRNESQLLSLPLVTATPDSNLFSIDLTVDHSAYNPREIEHVLRRSRNAPRAISVANSGGIHRVAGSLAVTRALGDAYLKTPYLSFYPYKRYAPYISAQPEISCRVIGQEQDKFLVLASDGVWERASGPDAIRWVQSYFKSVLEGDNFEHDGQQLRSLPLQSVRHGSRRRLRNSQSKMVKSSRTVSDFIIRCVLNKVRRSRNMSSLSDLLSLPRGRARRSKHDDITVGVVNLSGFIY